jgi:hypothetical protein
MYVGDSGTKLAELSPIYIYIYIYIYKLAFLTEEEGQVGQGGSGAVRIGPIGQS